jgi:serine/threonine protein kinase
MPSFMSYHLPLMSEIGPMQPMYLPSGFALISDIASREGVVQLVEPQHSRHHAPGEVRIIKSVRHEDRSSPPAEARILGNLAQLHPNIIRLFCCDLNIVDGLGYAQMLFEFCQGGDLLEQSRYRRATPFFALHVVISIAEALTFLHHSLASDGQYLYKRVMHGEAIVHQDIKEDNIFLRFPGSQYGNLPDIVLADFGCSNPASQTIPGVGCVGFMSPECRHQTVERLSHKTDIYSFGVMCIQLFDHSTSDHWSLYKDPRHLRLSSMYNDLGLATLLRRCVAINAADRCEFSNDDGSGVLPRIAMFQNQRSELARNGQVPDRGYWASKY